MKNTMKKYCDILDLRPTQFAVGMLEVDEKIASVQSLNAKQLKHYVDENTVPVVRAPNAQLYIVDHHHFLSVCYHLGIRRVRIEIVEDLKDLPMSYREFWRKMRASRQTYLYCQFGHGPHREFYLPRDIRGLADDPYRSLAWFVRKAGAFRNSEKNFAEFRWANFFRSKKLLHREGMAGFEKALRKAIELAQTDEAKRLPGFGKLNLAEKTKVLKKGEKKIKKYRERFKQREITIDAKSSGIR